MSDVDALYEVPLNSYDTTVDVHFYGTWSNVVEEPFDSLDIRGDTFTVGVVLSDNIDDASIFAFDVEVASSGSVDIISTSDPVPDASIFGFAGAATATGATGAARAGRYPG